jgi:hypothetical protein
MFELPPHPPAELTALVGAAGHLRVALVGYEGFEPVQRLVAAAVIDGNPIDPIIAKSLIHLSTREGSGGSLAGDAELLTDALDEAVFVDQREIEKSEQKHFEQAIRQLERFVEDKILVLRRELSFLSEKVRSAKQRRDQVVGSTARARIESDVEALASRAATLAIRRRCL